MGRGMIVAPQPEAVEAGAVVLRNGGNCVDGAIACALVQGVVDPLMCGITGFGSLQIYLPSKGVHTCIDFHGKVPAAASADANTTGCERSGGPMPDRCCAQVTRAPRRPSVN